MAVRARSISRGDAHKSGRNQSHPSQACLLVQLGIQAKRANRMSGFDAYAFCSWGV
jgi:hypothetical protein